jgi:hypothetical protein
MTTQVKAEMRSTKTVTRVSNTGKFFCFNNNVSNLYNNSVVAKIYGMVWYGMAYIFNNITRIAIVNAASNITYRPVIEADDTGRCAEYMNFNPLLF